MHAFTGIAPPARNSVRPFRIHHHISRDLGATDCDDDDHSSAMTDDDEFVVEIT